MKLHDCKPGDVVDVPGTKLKATVLSHSTGGVAVRANHFTGIDEDGNEKRADERVVWAPETVVKLHTPEKK